MVSKIESQLGRLPTWMNRSSGSSKTSGKAAPKTLGETPPIIEREANHPDLLPLLAHYGMLQKIRRKLKRFSGKDCKKIILARNTIGSADDQGNLYLGIDFLRSHQNNEALLAGVMAHEWGHLISNLSHQSSLEHLNWNQIFELRREEEASADVFCGRMMAMMDYPIEPICDFLTRAEKTEKNNTTLKYYAAPIRVAMIEEAFRRHFARKSTTKKIFQKRIYSNPYTSKLIAPEDS
ncbi:MAG: hypothetical protein H7A32_04010 [Deltaproteobacteria bacterium]|nr:hypothetical protein [Deltaproteobacteria bacterium]